MDGIKTFGILTLSENSELEISLTSGHFPFIKQSERFDDGRTRYFVLNVNLDTIRKYTTKFEQTSFLFCKKIKCENGSLLFESCYCEIDDSATCHKAKRKQFRIVEDTVDELDDKNKTFGGEHKYKIPKEDFERVSRRIVENIRSFEKHDDPDSALDFAINRVGMAPWYYRGRIYRGLLKKSPNNGDTDRLPNRRYA